MTRLVDMDFYAISFHPATSSTIEALVIVAVRTTNCCSNERLVWLRVCQHDVFVCLWPKRASASWKTGSTHAAHATSKLSRLPRSSNIHGYAHVYVPAHAADRVMMSHPNSVYISRATLLPLQADVDDNNKAMRGGWSAPPQLRPATRESEV
jgi:hypothetical protein